MLISLLAEELVATVAEGCTSAQSSNFDSFLRTNRLSVFCSCSSRVHPGCNTTGHKQACSLSEQQSLVILSMQSFGFFMDLGVCIFLLLLLFVCLVCFWLHDSSQRIRANVQLGGNISVIVRLFLLVFCASFAL